MTIEFLFVRGDASQSYYSVPYTGPLYLWLAPFLFLGIIIYIRQNIRLMGISSVIICAVFAANALSVFGSETQRTVIAAPFLVLIAGIGLIWTAEKIKRLSLRYVFICVITIVAAYQMTVFFHQYVWHASVHRPWLRNFGEKEMGEKAAKYASEFEKTVIASDPYIFLYFFRKTDPRTAQKESQEYVFEDELKYTKRKKVLGYDLMPMDCPFAGKVNVLYICKGTRVPLNSRVLDVVRYHDGQPHYIFLEFLPKPENLPLPENLTYMDNEKFELIDEKEKRFW